MMQTPPTTTGDEIRKARNYAGLTQVQLAKKMKNTQHCLSDWETGKRQPRVVRLSQIAKYCRCEFRVTGKGYVFEPGE